MRNKLSSSRHSRVLIQRGQLSCFSPIRNQIDSGNQRTRGWPKERGIFPELLGLREEFWKEEEEETTSYKEVTLHTKGGDLFFSH